MEFMQERRNWKPCLPAAFQKSFTFEECGTVDPVADVEEVQKHFPSTSQFPQIEFKATSETSEHRALNIGVIFSGGQAPGGHNVISGLYDAAKKFNKDTKVLGFHQGPDGILNCDYEELTDSKVDEYRNMGGFDMIGSGRTKIESPEQVQAAIDTAVKAELDGLVIIGGDDSNTNACVLAERFYAAGIKTRVIGVPKTIDGDCVSHERGLQASFGFDSACKVYASLASNIETDCLSAKKYYHFIRLMGRSASHIALEVALQSQPNMCLIGEEIEAKKTSLSEIVKQLADLVEERAAIGKNYGVILVPEGILEFIPGFGDLLTDLSTKMSQKQKEDSSFNPSAEWAAGVLEGTSQEIFNALPPFVQAQLLLDRDPHGNIQVSLIETEKFLIAAVRAELKKRNVAPKFNAMAHFFGYEGRCVPPSNFDAQYCYGLGYVACSLIDGGKTGYMSCLTDLHKPAQEWRPIGIPLPSLMNMELRHGEMKPVIKKALTNLDGPAFKHFTELRNTWRLEDHYRHFGGINYWGPVADVTGVGLALECAERCNE